MCKRRVQENEEVIDILWMKWEECSNKRPKMESLSTSLFTLKIISLKN